MLLSDVDLRGAVARGFLGISPYDPSLVQPSSIDVRLDNIFRMFIPSGFECIDPSIHQPNLTRKVIAPAGSPFTLAPGSFALASTIEQVTLVDHLAARVEGKSSLGRIGLAIHTTAGFIDPGFSGTVTLELSNVGPRPIKLWPGMRIGQLCVFQLSSPAGRPYGRLGPGGSHYQHQHGPTECRAWERWTADPSQCRGK